ncbi:MAG: hypothetical protein ABI478_04920 [Propionivibrio sp.]
MSVIDPCTGHEIMAVKEDQVSLATALQKFFDDNKTRSFGQLPLSRLDTA